MPSVTEVRREQATRPRPGHPRPAAPEAAGARTAARLGHRPEAQTGVRDILQVSDGSLYPALHKLEQDGWIKAEWRVNREQPPCQVLLAHPLGRAQLERESAKWERLAGAISYVVRLDEA